jgi:hypothetical protein
MNSLLAGRNLSAGNCRKRLNSIKQQFVRAECLWVSENEQQSTTLTAFVPIRQGPPSQGINCTNCMKTELNGICANSLGATVAVH